MKMRFFVAALAVAGVLMSAGTASAQATTYTFQSPLYTTIFNSGGCTVGECATYTAAKAGQHGFTKVLAEEARPYNVRVTLVVPGATDTAIWDDRPGFDRDRMMQADDVAGLVASIVARSRLSVEEITVLPPAGAL